MKRMTNFLFFILSIFSIHVFSQEYSQIDEKVLSYPDFTNIMDLGYRIQNDFESEKERVRAAFTWVVFNINYQRTLTLDEIFKPDDVFVYYSKEFKISEENKRELSRTNKAFRKRKGVCIDYSRILDQLFKQFNILSHIINGVSKTDIKDISGQRIYKNHAWNTIFIENEWKLLDATWASTYGDLGLGAIAKNYSEHYFFVPPMEFITDHFPADRKWQLLNSPIDLRTFFQNPVYYPGYFWNDVKLSKETLGILKTSDKDEHFIYFDELPKNHKLYYYVSGTQEKVRMKLKKTCKNSYVSKLRLKSSVGANSYLTIYMNKDPILNFKVTLQ